MLGIVKVGVILVNVNFCYVEGEFCYLFDNFDMVVLVYECCYVDWVVNVFFDMFYVRMILVVEDGLDQDYWCYGGVEFYFVIVVGLLECDFGECSVDVIYLFYIGGIIGFFKGVMWCYEDIYCVLFGGIDFVIGEFVKDEYDLVKVVVVNLLMICYLILLMIYGVIQLVIWMVFFLG